MATGSGLMEITFDRKTVGTCLMQRFALPTYQREYRWEVKHLQELLTDIQEEFLQNYDSSHGRSKVGEYSPYFLGTIITTPGENGTRSIVDGQQRLTTLSIILCYFHRFSKANPQEDITDVESLIRRRVFGASEFNIELDADRHGLFELLLDETEVVGEALDERVDSIHAISPSTREVYRLFSNVENFVLEEIRDDLLARFVDYITERVYLFEIGVPSEQDGHKVFVTMNDRGLRLAPIDLLKGYLLSNISDHEANGSANLRWATCIRELRSLGRDEDSTFFKTWLRAQYAVTTRGKSRGDSPGDFEIVGDTYHRWVVENSDLLGLNNSDDYHDLVERSIPFYVQQYKRLRAAEEVFTPEFPHVYYNGARNITLQYMAILSALDVSDTSPVVDKKIRVVSYSIDAFISFRIFTRRDNNYDNIKDNIFAISKRIRRQPLDIIVQELSDTLGEPAKFIDNIPTLAYWSIKRQDLLHLLARFASFLEDALDITNRVGFPDYVSRSRGNRTFDIEHLAPSKVGAELGFDDLGQMMTVDSDAYLWRNGIGDLILLPRGRNRSMRAMGYPEKRARYATENVLAQILTDEFYLNHPNVASFVATTGINLAPESAIGPEQINRRSVFYRDLASTIWSLDGLAALAR